MLVCKILRPNLSQFEKKGANELTNWPQQRPQINVKQSSLTLNEETGKASLQQGLKPRSLTYLSTQLASLLPPIFATAWSPGGGGVAGTPPVTSFPCLSRSRLDDVCSWPEPRLAIAATGGG